MDIMPPAPVSVDCFGLSLQFNVVTLLNSWLVMAVLALVAWMATRSLTRAPGRMQAAMETLVTFFEDICESTLGKEHGRRYLPFIGTLFLFILMSNIIGVIPNVLGALGWPGFVCPTQDLNTPLGLALIVVVVVHVSAIRIKGFRAWLWSFYEPSFPGGGRLMRTIGVASFVAGMALYFVLLRAYLEGFSGYGTGLRIAFGLGVFLFLVNLVLVTVYAVQLGRVPNVLMAPLNFVGEIGKAISHPFRLFGNIFGGFVILTVISAMVLHMGLPLILHAFFGLFIGLVQAFVFAMLALAYIAIQITGDEPAAEEA